MGVGKGAGAALGLAAHGAEPGSVFRRGLMAESITPENDHSPAPYSAWLGCFLNLFT